jgi:choline-sulfatase
MVEMVNDKPNVLFIMTDQHRADLMTCAGRDLVPTPSIDKIAERGVRFSNTYCPYPVCLASRMSMLTGLYAHNTAAINNNDRLDWRFRTMPNHFAENGYLTGLIGKMHFNDAHNRGFEYYMSCNDWLMYLGPKAQLYANEVANNPLAQVFFDYPADNGCGFPDIEDVWDGPTPWAGHVKKLSYDNLTSRMEPEDHMDSFIARESIKFLKQYKDQPFFLLTSFMKPHTPFWPPKGWAELYPPQDLELPEWGDLSGYPPHISYRMPLTRDRKKHLKAHSAGYRGNLAFVDSCIGQVYHALEELGLLDNTIVVYTSDHGEMDGDHGMFQKFCLFEPSIKVPLIISYPKSLPVNKVSEALIEQIGLYPTLCDLVGIEQPKSVTNYPIPNAPEKMDGISFADLIQDPTKEGPSEVYAEYALRSNLNMYMIRAKRYKYVHNHTSTHELYDIQEDPNENHNLINEMGLQGIVRELRDKLYKWYDPEQNPFRGTER